MSEVDQAVFVRQHTCRYLNRGERTQVIYATRSPVREKGTSSQGPVQPFWTPVLEAKCKRLCVVLPCQKKISLLSSLVFQSCISHGTKLCIVY